MRSIENQCRRDFLKTSAIVGSGLALGLLRFDSIGIAQAATAPSIYKLYAKNVYENLRYRPTWLPGSPVELGTVGLIEEGIFRPITDLNKLDIPFEAKVDADQDTIDFASKNGVTISFKAAGETNGKFEAIPKASAGVLIEFSHEGAVVLQLKDVSFNRIADQNSLSRALLKSIAVGAEFEAMAAGLGRYYGGCSSRPCNDRHFAFGEVKIGAQGIWFKCSDESRGRFGRPFRGNGVGNQYKGYR